MLGLRLELSLVHRRLTYGLHFSYWLALCGLMLSGMLRKGTELELSGCPFLLGRRQSRRIRCQKRRATATIRVVGRRLGHGNAICSIIADWLCSGGHRNRTFLCALNRRRRWRRRVGIGASPRRCTGDGESRRGRR